MPADVPKSILSGSDNCRRQASSKLCSCERLAGVTGIAMLTPRAGCARRGFFSEDKCENTMSHRNALSMSAIALIVLGTVRSARPVWSLNG